MCHRCYRWYAWRQHQQFQLNPTGTKALTFLVCVTAAFMLSISCFSFQASAQCTYTYVEPAWSTIYAGWSGNLSGSFTLPTLPSAGITYTLADLSSYTFTATDLEGATVVFSSATPPPVAGAQITFNTDGSVLDTCFIFNTLDNCVGISEPVILELNDGTPIQQIITAFSAKTDYSACGTGPVCDTSAFSRIGAIETAKSVWVFDCIEPPPPVPTMTQWGMILFMGGVGLVALWFLRHRRSRTSV